jgi:hypothetical protein
MNYYDISSAGPTALKQFSGIDLLSIPDKLDRNIQYGKIMKSNEKYKFIPNTLLNVSRILCKEYNGILYSQDSFVTNKKIELGEIVNQTIFNFKKNYFFVVLIINRTFDTYIALTDKDEVVIKGKYKKYIPEKLASMLLKKFTGESDWLTKFKSWFKYLNNNKYYLSNNKYLLTTTGLVEVTKESLLETYDVDKLMYWNYLLSFIVPMGIEYDIEKGGVIYDSK